MPPTTTGTERRNGPSGEAKDTGREPAEDTGKERAADATRAEAPADAATTRPAGTTPTADATPADGPAREDAASPEGGGSATRGETAGGEGGNPGKTPDPAVVDRDTTHADTTHADTTGADTTGAGDGEARVKAAVSWRTRAVGAAVAAVLATAVTAAVLQWREASALKERRDTRTAVATTAAEFGKALLSYDHTDLQTARDRVLSLAGEEFAKTYDEAFTAGGMEGVITQLKATATASVRDVYVGDVDEGRARAVAVFDSQVRSATGTRRVLGSYLEMKLILVKGRWLVDEVSTVGAADETVTNPDGSTRPSVTPSGKPSPEKPKKSD